MKKLPNTLKEMAPRDGWSWMTPLDQELSVIPYQSLLKKFKFVDVSDVDKGYIEFYDPICKVFYRITCSGYLYKKKKDAWYDLNYKTHSDVGLTRVMFNSYYEALVALLEYKALHTYKLAISKLRRSNQELKDVNSILEGYTDEWAEEYNKKCKKIKKLKKRLKEYEN